MLCDELIAYGAPQSGMDVSRLFPAIREAQKFVLGPDFASVADALSSDYTGLVRVFDRCRLPYAKTWIEVAHSDRPHFWKAAMQAPNFQQRPKRVGFLLSATREDLSAWKTHLFWSNEAGPSAAALAMQFDMTQNLNRIDTAYELNLKDLHPTLFARGTVEKHPGWTSANDDVRLAMLHHTEPASPDYDIPFSPDIPVERYSEFASMLVALAQSDWAGEAGFILSAIGLLNARNVVDTVMVDQRKLNKARVRRGKPPLFEHKVLKISHRQTVRAYGEGSRGDHGPLRAHMVRGHFKARRSGIFFWSPHVRGDLRRGQIDKSYDVQD
jgi:hypothetical protein